MTIQANVAIIGGTHLHCETLLEVLQERAFPLASLDVYDEPEHEGDFVAFNKKSISIKPLAGLNTDAYDIIFNFDKNFLQKHGSKIRATTYVINLAAADSTQENNFILPSVNPDDVDRSNILQNPDPAAIATGIILSKLNFDIAQLHINVMQPVSSYGKAGVDELAKQTTNLLNAKPLQHNVFDQQIAFNVLTTNALEGEASREENTTTNALKQIYPGGYKLNVNVVTVPVFYGVSINITIQTYDAHSAAEIHDALAGDESLELIEQSETEPLPSVVGDANGADKIYISRIRTDAIDQNLINLWCVLDNGRKGSTLNGVQTAEILVKSHL